MKDHQKLNNEISQREQELTTQLTRALADYDNLKKRFEKEKQDVIKYSNEMLLMNIIGVVDALSMTLEQLYQVLQHSGFTEVTVEKGQEFNPEIMEATESDGTSTTVIEVYNSAYKLHGKLIRPARVKVGTVEEKEKE
ncbi:hypothetical protein CO180_01845 [candidate division WWE3 bacterium CG_4_9_14_3_um_filter_41_6]|uniref:Protein GrpE n=1 Tax=candidate division WWE3 bacterium CG_4_10_14_0_2_um_filter_41_14 TaxID=1975072 RepID=A0A2M7TK41_UNCKA|nr:MAG: hypothetical protein COY32_02570 [candidate division WWE3 bacterium CG_4_10_14_0_2_um_filter_41_14]PJA38977.1 MAG: hypothetical protein CO180_01845 [candidate division WWE3 bacterium CG_4_9_14_3_um_filter_41_6]